MNILRIDGAGEEDVKLQTAVWTGLRGLLSSAEASGTGGKSSMQQSGPSLTDAAHQSMHSLFELLIPSPATLAGEFPKDSTAFIICSFYGNLGLGEDFLSHVQTLHCLPETRGILVMRRRGGNAAGGCQWYTEVPSAEK